MSAGVIANREQEYKRPLPEFEGENLKECDEIVASAERAQAIETESQAKNNGQGASQDPNGSSSNELKLMVNEMVDKLGPLSVDEVEKIREWLKLGS